MTSAQSSLGPVVDTPDASGERERQLAGASDATLLASAALQKQWNASSAIVAARIHEARQFLADARRRDSSAETDLWTDDLEGVRSALDDLRAYAVDAPIHLLDGPHSPLAAYLTAAFVWCGDSARDVKDSIRGRQLGTERRRKERTSFAADSDAYVACFLEPFFRTLSAACAKESRAGELVRASAERLQARIVALNWEFAALSDGDGRG